MPAIDIDRDPAHQAAQRELDKPIYPKGSLTQRLQEWIHELLFRLIEKGSSVPGGWFTVAVLLSLLIVAIVIAIRVARRTMRTQRDHQLFDTGQLSADQYRAAAERLAAEGDWAAAIRHRLRAVARGLEETGTLDPSAGRTANELARDAGARLPHLALQLSEAAMTFNEVTYGQRPGTLAGYQVIVELDDHLRFRSAVDRPGIDGAAPVDAWAPVR